MQDQGFACHEHECTLVYNQPLLNAFFHQPSFAFEVLIKNPIVTRTSRLSIKGVGHRFDGQNANHFLKPNDCLTSSA